MAVKVVVTEPAAPTMLTAEQLEVGKLYHVVQPASVQGCIVLGARGWPVVIAPGSSYGVLGSVASNLSLIHI